MSSKCTQNTNLKQEIVKHIYLRKKHLFCIMFDQYCSNIKLKTAR
jgi:hypothetical protein